MYWIGRRDGKQEATGAALAFGTWVEFVKPTTGLPGFGKEFNRFEIPVGVKGLIVGVDKWGRSAMWLSPQHWTKHVGVFVAYDIRNAATKVRVVAPSAISHGEMAGVVHRMKELQSQDLERLQTVYRAVYEADAAPDASNQ